MLHLMLLGLNYPPLTQIVFSLLMQLVNIELIDTFDFYNKVFKLDPDSIANSPLNYHF